MWCLIEILLVLVGVLVKLICIQSGSNENSRSEAEKISNELNEQVTEINLLRKSNAQLGEEKKLYFDECQKLGETSQKTKAEIEKLETILAVKENNVTALKKEKEHLERRVDELDIALKMTETSQTSLRAERDEEFKSLQLQVNLLRESNAQLREENKLKVDECQKLRETSQKARTEIENLETILAVKENNVTDLKKEKEHLERRVDELLERWQNISVEELDRMKVRVQHMQEICK